MRGGLFGALPFVSGAFAAVPQRGAGEAPLRWQLAYAVAALCCHTAFKLPVEGAGRLKMCVLAAPRCHGALKRSISASIWQKPYVMAMPSCHNVFKLTAGASLCQKRRAVAEPHCHGSRKLPLPVPSGAFHTEQAAILMLFAEIFSRNFRWTVNPHVKCVIGNGYTRTRGV